ncbi:hypothetical protein Tco_0992358 [Tanacetum coccineum]|uniref:Uncharacterized protein n=1 Tax=Tanacetum coccineum TaxID=301880 RepID=A0ABQ5F2Z2_9ASTR
MESLDYRLNPIYTIKECSSCEALYTKSCGYSKGGFIDKFVCDPNKTPESSQRPPPNCPNYGDPIDGLYCRRCALLRKKVEEVWSTICDENEIFQDFLNTSKSSNDNTNVVNAPQEPFVFNQDPGKNSSQSPPHIDHHCCYGCGDSSNGIFCQRCTCESCGNGAHYGYNCPPKVPIISNPEPCYNQNVDEFPQTLPSFHPTCYSGDENSFTYDSNLNFVDDSPNPPPQPPTYSYEFCGNDAHYGHDCPPQVPFIYNPEPEELADFINTLNWNRPAFYRDDNEDDDEEYTIVITPVLPTVEPDNSLSMRDEHLSTKPEKEESSVKDLIPIPMNYDSLYSEDIDYIDASPPGFELIRLEETSPPTSPNSFLEETNISYNSLPESETFCFNLEEKSSGNPTSYTDLSLSHYEAFFCDSEPDSGDSLWMLCREFFDNPSRKPRVSSTVPHSLVFDTLLQFSFENEDNIFNPGILSSNEEKSPHLLSHRDFKAFQLISDLSKSPLKIDGEGIPIMDVPYFLYFYPSLTSSSYRGSINLKTP